MDKELQEIKTALDSITNNMYGISQIGTTIEDIKEAIAGIGQIGPKATDYYVPPTAPATLGDIKESIDALSAAIRLNNTSSSVSGNVNTTSFENAVDRNTEAVEDLVEAVRTIAEIQLQHLTSKEEEMTGIAEFNVLPWAKDNEPNLKFGWVEDLEQSETNIEDASF